MGKWDKAKAEKAPVKEKAKAGASKEKWAAAPEEQKPKYTGGGGGYARGSFDELYPYPNVDLAVLGYTLKELKTKSVDGEPAVPIQVWETTHVENAPYIFFATPGPTPGDLKENTIFSDRQGMFLRWVIKDIGYRNYNIVFYPMSSVLITNEAVRSDWDKLRTKFETVVDKLKPAAIITYSDAVLENLAHYIKDAPFDLTEPYNRGIFQEATINGHTTIVTPSNRLTILARGGKDKNHHDNQCSQFRLDLIRTVCECTKDMNSFRELPTIVDLDTVDKVRKAINKLIRSGKPFTFDTETTGLSYCPGDIKLLCISFAASKTKGYTIFLDHYDSGWSSDEKKQIRALLRKLFQSENYKICHNLSYDYMVINNTLTKAKPKPQDDVFNWVGIRPVNCKYDTMHLIYQIDEAISEATKASSKADTDKGSIYGKIFKLENASKVFLNYVDPVWHKMKGLRAALNTVEKSKVIYYAGVDAVITHRLWILLVDIVRTRGEQFLNPVMNIMAPTDVMTAELRISGMPIDKESVSQLMDPRHPKSMKRLIQQEVDLLPTIEEIQKAEQEIKDATGTATLDLFDDPETVFSHTKGRHLHYLYFKVMKLLPPVFNPMVDESGKVQMKGKYPILETEDTWYANNLRKEKLGLLYTPGKPEVSSWYYPTGKEMSELHPENAVVLKVEFLKKADKQMGTFLKALHDKGLEHGDGRPRGSYSSTKTVTGRLASYEPNFQNLPNGRDEITKTTKKIMMAEGSWVEIPKRPSFGRWEGDCIVAADYGTNEIRSLAFLAQDEVLAKIFREVAAMKAEFFARPTEKLYTQIWTLGQGDVHKMNASLLFNTPIHEVTKAQRTSVKSLTFLSTYSANPIPQLASNLGISTEEAKELFDKFLGRFPGTKQFLADCITTMATNGYTEAFSGCRRNLYGVWSNDVHVYKHYRNVSLNAISQGQASMWTSLGVGKAIDTIAELGKYGDWRIYNIVHDAIYGTCKHEEAFDMFYVMQKACENPGADIMGISTDFCPLEVDCDMGIVSSNLQTYYGIEDQKELLAKWMKGTYGNPRYVPGPPCPYDSTSYKKWKKETRERCAA